MLRRHWLRAFLISIAAALLLFRASTVVAPAATGNDAFGKLTREFIEADLRTYPEFATEEGDHRYDNRLTDMSRAAIESRIRATKEWKHRFEALGSDHLAAANEADREWLVALLDGRLLDDEQIRSYERSPGEYLPTEALHVLVKRNFAPVETRMRSATTRETAALHNLAEARVNLKPARTAKVTVDITLSQMPGMISFLQKDLPAINDGLPH